MSDATFQAALQTIIETVTDIGNVYTDDDNCLYSNLVSDLNSASDARYTTSNAEDVIRFVIIGVSEINGFRRQATGKRAAAHRTYVYSIKFYAGLDRTGNAQDNGRRDFIDRVNLATEALESNNTIGGSDFQNAAPALTQFSFAMFGGVLCHYAEIIQTVEGKGYTI